MKSIFIKYGTIYGLFSIVVALSFYFNLAGMGINSVVNLGGLFVVLYFASKAIKRQQGGTATFGQLIKAYVPILAIGIVISILFSVILVIVISEDQKTKMVDSVVSSQTSMYQAMGMDEAQVARMEEDLSVKMRDQLFNPGMMALSSLYTFLMMLVLSLIPAAIFKKNPTTITAEKSE